MEPRTISVKVDSKGRLCLPVSVRKSFGISEGMELTLLFDLENCALLIVPKGGTK